MYKRFYFVFQAVNSILRHVAQIQGFKSNEELEDLYRKTAWKFEAKNKKKGSSYDWFKQVSWIRPIMLETGPIFVPQQPTFCGSQNCQK
jgi:translation initiation factor 2 subunit 1